MITNNAFTHLKHFRSSFCFFTSLYHLYTFSILTFFEVFCKQIQDTVHFFVKNAEESGNGICINGTTPQVSCEMRKTAGTGNRFPCAGSFSHDLRFSFQSIRSFLRIREPQQSYVLQQPLHLLLQESDTVWDRNDPDKPPYAL